MNIQEYPRLYFFHSPDIDISFQWFAIMDKAAMTISLHVFLCTCTTYVLWEIHLRIVFWSQGVHTFNIIICCQISLKLTLPILTPTTSAWILRPYSFKYLTFYRFYLMGVKWYLLVVLICISLITNEVEHLYIFIRYVVNCMLNILYPFFF